MKRSTAIAVSLALTVVSSATCVYANEGPTPAAESAPAPQLLALPTSPLSRASSIGVESVNDTNPIRCPLDDNDDGYPFTCQDLPPGTANVSTTDFAIGGRAFFDGQSNYAMELRKPSGADEFRVTFTKQEGSPCFGGYAYTYLDGTTINNGCTDSGFSLIAYYANRPSGDWHLVLTGPGGAVLVDHLVHVHPASVEKVGEYPTLKAAINTALSVPLITQLRNFEDVAPAYPVRKALGSPNFVATFLSVPNRAAGHSAVSTKPDKDAIGRTTVTVGDKVGTYVVSIAHPDADDPATAAVFSINVVERLEPEDNEEDEEDKEDSKEEDCLNAAGDPITVTTGTVYHTQVDYARTGLSPLEFKRTYKSRGSKSRLTGTLWSTTFDRFVILPTSGKPLRVRRPNGNTIRFTAGSGGYAAQPHFHVSLTQTASGYRFVDANQIVEEFDTTGKLLRVTDLQGRVITAVYKNGVFTGVTTNTGESLTFKYGAYNQLSSVTDHAGRVWTYAYDGYANLRQVQRPEGKWDHYAYQHINPHLMTYAGTGGATFDPNGHHLAWEYDANGRGTASYVAEVYGDGIVDRVDVAYADDGGRTVFDSRGNATTYATVRGNNKGFVASVRGPEYATCGLGDVEREFDAAMNVAASTRFGRTTRYGAYDAKGQNAFRLEAAGTASERRTDYEYDSRFRGRVTRITKPSVVAGQARVVSATYNAQGQPTQLTLSGRNPIGASITKATNYEYAGPLSQMSRIDGPRTDVSDVTSYTYDATTKRLKAVTDPNGILVRSNITWSKTGKILTEDRPNGLRVTYTYLAGTDLLESIAETAGTLTRKTTWTYTTRLKVGSVRFSDGVNADQVLMFDYDASDQLEAIRSTSTVTDTIRFTLDENGNRDYEVRTLNGSTKRWIDRVFDRYNRLDKVIQANNTYDLDYHPDGTLRQVIDGRANASTYTYDDFKRLTNVVEPGAIETTIAYNAADRISEIVDGHGARTGYDYDDFGRLVRLTSPDSGTSTFDYDASGNLVRTVDAKGQVTTYTYDAGNRLRTIDRVGVEYDETWSYDTCTNGSGRLCSKTNGIGEAVAFQYDPIGRITRVTNNGASVGYGYDGSNNVTEITYPSGRKVTYRYDALGRPLDANLVVGSTTTALVTNITYAPFGPATSWRLGNGKIHTRQFDSQYWLQSASTPGVSSLAFSQRDANGNLERWVADGATHQYGFDALNRLTSATGVFGQRSYGYDAVGNRTSLVADGQSTVVTYEPQSNRLDVLGGFDITLDANGNLLEKRTGAGVGLNFAYSPHNRLSSITEHGSGAVLGTYRYNALGQRSQKTVQGVTRRYAYGLSPLLLAEIDAAGNVSQEYAYLNGYPVALLGPYSAPTPPPPVDLVRDNGTPTGDFASKSDQKATSGSYLLLDQRQKTVIDTHVWSFTVPSAGAYDVFVWWMQRDGTGAAVYNYFVNGTQTNLVTSGLPRYAWVKLGNFQLPVGTTTLRFQEGGGADPGTYSVDAARIVLTQSGSATPAVQYIDVDHLGVPRAVSDLSGSVIWRATYDPFGAATVNDDSDGNGQHVTLNLRFAGQYFDAESGLHYNYYRDYDSSLGRYLESDPIGLVGGMNTFAYARLNPLRYMDPMGLSDLDILRLEVAFYDVLNDMTTEGLRLENPTQNNFEAFWDDDSTLLRCSDQTAEVIDRLRTRIDNGDLKLDDRWEFQYLDNLDAREAAPFVPGHIWGQGVSHNPADPVIQFDPRAGSFNQPPYAPWVN